MNTISFTEDAREARQDPNGYVRSDGQGIVQCPHRHHQDHSRVSRYDGVKPIYACKECGVEWRYDLKSIQVPLGLYQGPQDS